MKKKLLSIILMVTALILVGCGAEESEGEVAGIYMTDGPKYQYQMIITDEIMVQYEDGRPDKKLSDYSGSYTTDTAVYLGNEVGVYLDGEHYSTVVEYVPYTNIDFKRNVDDVSLFILYSRGMETKTDWFEGTITYADGYVGSIDAEEVELKRSGNILVVNISFRGEGLRYEIVIPEAWDDMNLNEQSQEEINEWYDGLGSGDSGVTEESMSSSVVKDGDFLSTLGVSKAAFISHLESIGYFSNDAYMNIGPGIQLDPRDELNWDCFIDALEDRVDEYDMSMLDTSDPAIWVVQLLYVADYDIDNYVLKLQNGYDPLTQYGLTYDEEMECYAGEEIGKQLRNDFPTIKKLNFDVNSEDKSLENYSDEEIQSLCESFNTGSKSNELDLCIQSCIMEGEFFLKNGNIDAFNKRKSIYDVLNISEYLSGSKVYIDYETHIQEYGYILETRSDVNTLKDILGL